MERLQKRVDLQFQMRLNAFSMLSGYLLSFAINFYKSFGQEFFFFVLFGNIFFQNIYFHQNHNELPDLMTDLIAHPEFQFPVAG